MNIPKFCKNDIRKHSHQHEIEIYEKGHVMVKNEINMFTILETMMKIKASLTVLIGDDK